MALVEVVVVVGEGGICNDSIDTVSFYDFHQSSLGCNNLRYDFIL